MAITVFPSANGVGGAGQKVLSEGNLARWMMPGARNYVISGFGLPDGLPYETTTIPVDAGAAVIDGYLIVADASLEATISSPTPGTTYYFYLRIIKDVLGCVANADVYVSTGAPPAESYILLGAMHYYFFTGWVSRSQPAPRAPWYGFLETLRAGNLYYATFFDSADAFATTGTVTANQQHIAIKTAATSGASASLTKQIPGGMTLDTSRPYCIRMGIGFHPLTEVSGYAGIGTPASKQFIGISFRDHRFYGIRGDGTTLVETDEIASTVTGVLLATTDITIRVEDGQAAWQANGRKPVAAAAYLPTQLDNSTIVYAQVKTATTEARSMALSHWTVLQIG